MCSVFSSSVFQSTPPAREATSGEPGGNADAGVSIHASRTGGDVKTQIEKARDWLFQSTPPAREAT